MRHNKKINHLSRTKAHREAMLANMAASLIKHKRIFTTTPKAKALRKYVEPLITKSKPGPNTLHLRRIVFASLQDKYAVKELFGTVAEKIGDRPGGYTRIIKTGSRLGDNAAMCFIELVDFNENMLKTTSKKTVTKTRRSRRKSTVTGSLAAESAQTSNETKTDVPEEEIKKMQDVETVVSEEAVKVEETETNNGVATAETETEACPIDGEKKEKAE
ncbi:MAG: 50S ribosomal protein L17 [Tannerella sp.]|jgi:large subunit ribosomal protein L17|nr:50S ribosomal protein L17 [Tannerella sp.]